MNLFVYTTVYELNALQSKVISN